VQLEVVEEFKLDLVRNGENCEIQLHAPVVKVVFHIRRDAVRALVQDNEAGSVVKKPGKGQPLLLTRREVLLPIPQLVEMRPHDPAVLGELKVRAAVCQDLGRDMSPLQTIVDVAVRAPLLLHLLLAIRVDHQVTQSPNRDEVDLR